MKRTKPKISEITLDINALSHDGRGIASIEGKTTFVHGAITDEKVVCKIIKQHRRYYEGNVIEVIHPSPTRVQPLCDHFNVCGGCSLQHMDLKNQLDLKQKTLLEHLKHFGKLTPEIILPPISGNLWGYRKKARLGVRYVHKKGRVFVGFREKSSNFLVDLHQCPILHKSIGTKIQSLTKLIESLSQYLQIPQIEVACGDDTTALIFRHLEPLSPDDIKKLCEFGEYHAFDIYLQPNPPQKIHKIWPDDKKEYLNYTLKEYAIEIQFQPHAFTQVNSEMNALLIQKALELLEPKETDHILDLFCGLGNFTLPIARFVKSALGIEGSETMVQEALNNAHRNQINNATFYATNLMAPNRNDAWMQAKYDKILLDPPRAGAKEIIPYFAQFSPQKIVYVSCNTATLARDANILVNNLGFTLRKSGIINMFPHTSHIETIALFEK